MTNHELPTSEWEHSHALEEGDELLDHTGKEWRVTEVTGTGDVEVRRLDDTHGEVENWSEEGTTEALATGSIERKDGLSHELATF